MALAFGGSAALILAVFGFLKMTTITL